jgi:hypothetical protein
MLATLMAAAAGIGAACATTMTVGSHVDRAADVSALHTFQWGPADALPTGDARLDRDPFFKDQVQGAVEKQLALRGIALARPDATPDLLIHYHANIARRIDVNRVDRGYGYCVVDECPGDMEYEAGTLVLDVVDARTNRLLWRGWAQRSVEDVLDDHDRMARMIAEAISRMLQRFPRAL